MLSIVHVKKMLDFTVPVSENDFPLLFTMNLGPYQPDSQPFFLGARESELPQRIFESICGRHQARHASDKGSCKNHASIHLEKSNICTNANKKPYVSWMSMSLKGKKNVQVQGTWCCVAPTICTSAKNVIIPTPPHPMMLRSTNHVCKCKKHDVA